MPSTTNDWKCENAGDLSSALMTRSLVPPCYWRTITRPPALSGDIRQALFPNSRLGGRANLLVMPTLDAANISFNLLKSLGDNVTVGPILLGVARSAHVLTPTATVRRIVNMTALAVVDANARLAL